MDTDVIRSAARAIEGNAAAIAERPNDWPDEILNRVRIIEQDCERIRAAAAKSRGGSR